MSSGEPRQRSTQFGSHPRWHCRGLGTWVCVAWCGMRMCGCVVTHTMAQTEDSGRAAMALLVAVGRALDEALASQHRASGTAPPLVMPTLIVTTSKNVAKWKEALGAFAGLVVQQQRCVCHVEPPGTCVIAHTYACCRLQWVQTPFVAQQAGRRRCGSLGMHLPTQRRRSDELVSCLPRWAGWSERVMCLFRTTLRHGSRTWPYPRFFQCHRASPRGRDIDDVSVWLVPRTRVACACACTCITSDAGAHGQIRNVGTRRVAPRSTRTPSTRRVQAHRTWHAAP